MTVSRALFRLVGREEGSDVDVSLLPGTLRVGTSSESDLRLRGAGVSRRHALVIARATGLVVIDQGSTNGTYIDGHRIERGGAGVGSELRFGHVVLRVEPARETELAIVLPLDELRPDGRREPGRSATPTDATPGTTPRWHGRAGETLPGASLRPTRDDPFTEPLREPWLEHVDAVLAALPRRGHHGDEGDDGPDLGNALEPLLEAAGATGVAWLAWPERNAVVLASRGVLGAAPARDAIRTHRPDPSQGAVRVAAFDEPEPVVAAFLDIDDDTPRGLLLWGPDVAARVTPAALRVLARLFGRLDERPRPAPLVRERPQLDFDPRLKIGTSRAMTELYDQMARLAGGDLPVLIVGETGVGKEGIARTLHRSSKRASRPFVAVNCAAVPADQLEAEMFGVARGAATGVEARPGCFREADGGVLFLDEVGDMPPELQVKLLRVLEEGEVRPVGGRTISVDVRVLSATNADLDEQMATGRLRRDLFYRLAGTVLHVPPLRHRRTDIPGLVEHFLRFFAREHGSRLRGLSLEALRRLVAYGWPGNVRQLEHEVRGLVLRAGGGDVIESSILSDAIRTVELEGELDPRPRSAPTVPSATDAPLFDGEGEGEGDGDDDLRLAPRLEALERRLVVEALERTRGQLKPAARLLGISRNGLKMKLERLGLRS